MRAWFVCIFILLSGALLGASPVLGVSVKTQHFAKATVVQRSVIAHHNPSQHCDKMEETEVITGTYSQYNPFGPVVLTVAHGLKTLVRAPGAINLSTGRNNARIQPFYKLILFPFHAFW